MSTIIQDEFMCEDVNGCQNNLSYNECMEDDLDWDSPECHYLQLERLPND